MLKITLKVDLKKKEKTGSGPQRILSDVKILYMRTHQLKRAKFSVNTTFYQNYSIMIA